MKGTQPTIYSVEYRNGNTYTTYDIPKQQTIHPTDFIGVFIGFGLIGYSGITFGIKVFNTG